MLQKLRPRSVYDVVAALACFLVLAGGTAYAANTIRTGDIVDNEVFTTDVRDDTLGYGGLTHPDLSPGSVRSSEVLNGSVTRFDIGDQEVDGINVQNGSLNGLDLADGGLNDEDIAQPGGTFVNFLGNIGNVPARTCVSREVTGINASGDHVMLAAGYDGSAANLSYSVEYTAGGGSTYIKACNPTNLDINDSFTRFNLLVIDAQ